MKDFDIQPINRSLESVIQEKIDNLNKPKGALGRLEELAMQVCLIQQSLTPSLTHPCHLLLGGDHGIEREGVSVSPREVTWQQMINFTHGGGGVNMFCRQHGFKLRIVDVGVDYDFSGEWREESGERIPIIDKKIAYGTKNFLYEPAMSEASRLSKWAVSLLTNASPRDAGFCALVRWVSPTPRPPASGCHSLAISP